MKKILVFVLAICMIFVLVACTNNNSQEDSVANSFDLLYNPNKTLIQNSVPKEILDYLNAEFDMSIDDIVEKYKEVSEDVNEESEYRYGDNFKRIFEIVETTELSKEECDDIVQLLTDVGLESTDIEKIAEAEVKVSMKGDEKESVETQTYYLFMVGGKWYTLETIEMVLALA